MKYKYGIIGCGGISNRFAGVLAQSETGEIHGAAARNPESAREFCAKHGGKPYADYDELIQDTAVDVVYIGTVHSHHYDLVKQCLNRGKNVLCEKPLVLHAAQARELADLARQQNCFLMEAMWTRCNPVVIEATRWVREGRIGKPVVVNAAFCSRNTYNPEGRIYNPALAGGALYDVGVYVIEFATGLLGENPSEIHAAVTNADTGVDDYVSMALRFPSGAQASLQCGISAYVPHKASIHGTEGYIEFEPEFWKPKSCTLYQSKGEPIDTFSVEFEDGFCYQIDHVADMLNQGRIESTRIPWQDTIACAAVFDAIL
ncbi:Gfo/Idh/MocA family oxidoreductase [Ruminococcaceae bacterium OttesenSCG-928-L11]|nr:Gfo/Idh/MocA family oxidoreductase [Ruminococcaceae bacterium OttesenSCG-928-L11]